MSNWVHFRNGNYNVHINLSNGTKIRENDLDCLIPEYPESMDIKITNMCNMGCSFCHENSKPDGLHGEIMNLEFIDTLQPYTELAIGGGNPLEHPDLEAFLRKCQSLFLIPSMTVHQKHFMENLDFLRMLRDEKLIYGLGVSVTNVSPELIDALKEFPNAVVHVIAGVVSRYTLKQLSGNNLKVLLLGYKDFRRGAELHDKLGQIVDDCIQVLYNLLPTMKEERWFQTISFDNLAIKQLEPSRLLSEEEYDQFYMGDDGSHTMYVDCVNKKFAVSSTSETTFDILPNIKDMFAKVREVSGHD